MAEASTHVGKYRLGRECKGRPFVDFLSGEALRDEDINHNIQLGLDEDTFQDSRNTSSKKITYKLKYCR